MCSSDLLSYASPSSHSCSDELLQPQAGPFRIMRCLPGRYVDDAGDLDAPAGMSYADWEAQRSEVQIPKWMEKILRIPGGAFCLLLILLPFTLVCNWHPVLEYSPSEPSDDGLISIVKCARGPFCILPDTSTEMQLPARGSD